MNPVTLFLFILESYQALAHAVVFFRIRLLPLKDSKRVRHNFLLEAALVFVTNFVVTSSQLRWLSVHSIALHLYYFVFWDSSRAAAQLIAFMSLEWTRRENSREWSLFAFCIVGSDTISHVIDMYLLGQLISPTEIAVGSIIVVMAMVLVFFSPLYAWSSPTCVPPWVEKRIEPVVD